jgi:hypothetical protein
MKNKALSSIENTSLVSAGGVLVDFFLQKIHLSFAVG